LQNEITFSILEFLLNLIDKWNVGSHWKTRTIDLHGCVNTF